MNETTINLCGKRSHLNRPFPYLCIDCPRKRKEMTARLQALSDNRETNWSVIYKMLLKWDRQPR